MKNIRLTSLAVLIATIIFMGINWFIFPFSDLLVRSIGLLMLISMVVLIYSTVKMRAGNR